MEVVARFPDGAKISNFSDFRAIAATCVSSRKIQLYYWIPQRFLWAAFCGSAGFSTCALAGVNAHFFIHPFFSKDHL